MSRQASDTEALKAMQRFGGSFESAIGQAGLCANETNLLRLKRAFPDFFITYRTIAEVNNLSGTEEEQPVYKG